MKANGLLVIFILSLSMVSCGMTVSQTSYRSSEESGLFENTSCFHQSSNNSRNSHQTSINQDLFISSEMQSSCLDSSALEQDVFPKNDMGFFREPIQIDKNDLNYFFITDLHIDSNDELIKSTSILDYVVEYTNSVDYVDFVCVGGDLTTLYFESKKQWSEWVQKILLPLKKCQKPVFILNGNHDDNSNCLLELLNRNCVINEEWNQSVLDFVVNVDVVKDSNHPESKYYFYDVNKSINYRIACLDSNDRPKSLCNKEYWGFSESQINWLNNKVLDDNNRYYVFLSHMSIDSNLNVDYKKIEFANELYNMIENKKDYRILINSFGHCHLNFIGNNRFGLPSSCTSTLLYGGIGGYDGQDLYSDLNDLNAGWQIIKKEKWGFSFNLFSVGEQYIKRFAFGDGDDALFVSSRTNSTKIDNSFGIKG